MSVCPCGVSFACPPSPCGRVIAREQKVGPFTAGGWRLTAAEGECAHGGGHWNDGRGRGLTLGPGDCSVILRGSGGGGIGAEGEGVAN